MQIPIYFDSQLFHRPHSQWSAIPKKKTHVYAILRRNTSEAANPNILLPRRGLIWVKATGLCTAAREGTKGRSVRRVLNSWASLLVLKGELGLRVLPPRWRSVLPSPNFLSPVAGSRRKTRPSNLGGQYAGAMWDRTEFDRRLQLLWRNPGNFQIQGRRSPCIFPGSLLGCRLEGSVSIYRGSVMIGDALADCAPLLELVEKIGLCDLVVQACIKSA